MEVATDEASVRVGRDIWRVGLPPGLILQQEHRLRTQWMVGVGYFTLSVPGGSTFGVTIPWPAVGADRCAMPGPGVRSSGEPVTVPGVRGSCLRRGLCFGVEGGGCGSCDAFRDFGTASRRLGLWGARALGRTTCVRDGVFGVCTLERELGVNILGEADALCFPANFRTAPGLAVAVPGDLFRDFLGVVPFARARDVEETSPMSEESPSLSLPPLKSSSMTDSL